MRQVVDGKGKTLAIVGCTLVLLLVFVVYRARTFNYCVGYGDRLSIVAGDQSCAADENPIEFSVAWRVQGLAGKFKTVGRTVARSFAPN